MSDAHGVARDQLRAFVERIERLEEEKKTIADDIKDVYGEAKGMGFDTKIMKQVIALRKKDDQERTEEDLIRDTYLAALGMLPDFEADSAPAPVAPKPTRSPAMALQSPRNAAEAVSERTRDAVGRPTSERQPEAVGSEEDGVTGGESAATNSAIAPASHGEAEAPSVESVRPLDEGSPDANTGGDHVTASENAQPDQDGPGLVSTPRPSKHPILLLRPHCQHPGEEVCGGSGTNHCQKCLAALREVETA